ncbi:hypothetical protein ACWEQC_06620 [Streptomyces shenzhenensis]
MAQDSWPSPAHNSRAVTDVEYEKIAAQFSGDGVYGSPADTAVVSAGPGLTVNVRADVYASVRGHAWTSGTSTVSLSIGANTSGQTRTDRIVLRLDRSNWTVRAVVKAGAPGGGAPALSQQTGDTGTYEIPLALVTGLSGAAAVTVTRSELYVGTRPRACTSTTRNPNPDVSELCFETDTGRVRMWTGTAWVIVYEDSGVISVNSSLSAWSNEVESVLEKRNGTVTLRLGSFKRLAGTLLATTESRLPVLIPAAYRHPTRDQYILGYTTGVNVARMILFARNNADRPGQLWLTNKAAIGTGDSVLPQSGVSWVVD